MANSLVLDANVAVAWHVHQSPQLTRYAVAVSKGIAAAGLQICVPPLWDYEVASVLIRLHRNPDMRFTEAQLDYALRVLDGADVQVHHITASMADIARLAMHYRLSGFDAVYLETARILGVPIATFDGAMRAACRQFKIPLYDPQT